MLAVYPALENMVCWIGVPHSVLFIWVRLIKGSRECGGWVGGGGGGGGGGSHVRRLCNHHTVHDAEKDNVKAVGQGRAKSKVTMRALPVASFPGM